MNNCSIAVLIPCYNETLTIAKVVDSFRATIPGSNIYVYDNGSEDDTVTEAKKSGAIVRREYRQGKGNVVRRMFADVEADIYVLIDGDNTYDVDMAPTMINKLIDEKLDMVIGIRCDSDVEEEKKKIYRLGHRFGNKLFAKLIRVLFGACFSDVFSGYRVFSRRFVKSFPAECAGFDIETELSVHSLELRIPTAEVKTKYTSRPDNSFSKLNTYRDGIKILMRILLLLKQVRPFLFFSVIAIILALLSIAIFIPVLSLYLKTGLVERFPTAILCLGIGLLSFTSFICGLILDNICQSKRVFKRLFYLSLPYVGNSRKK